MSEDLVYLDLTELYKPIYCEGPDCNYPATHSVGHAKCGNVVYACDFHSSQLEKEQKALTTLFKCARCGEFGLPRVLFKFHKI